MLKIINKPTNSLIAYINNARTHSDYQIKLLASSIKEFGFNNPILIDSAHGVIAGHGRLLAAKLLALEEVPTICLDHLSDIQKKAYILADNRLALDAGWDLELLKLEMELLQDKNFNLDLIGFSQTQIDEILGNTNKEDDLQEPASEKNEFIVIVHCNYESEQKKLYEELEKRGYQCKLMM